MKKLITFFTLLLITSSTFAAEEFEMATVMRSNGKIFVVVGVLLIIFLVLATFLFTLDKRIKKLEK